VATGGLTGEDRGEEGWEKRNFALEDYGGSEDFGKLLMRSITVFFFSFKYCSYP
jgi:hypothetical protein